MLQSDIMTQLRHDETTMPEKKDLILKDNISLGWRSIRLKHLCEENTSIDPTKTPDRSFIYVDVSSVSNQSFSIISANTSKIQGQKAPSRARKLIRTDDVIFATVRPALRRVALVPSELNNQVCSTGFCVVRAKKDYLNSHYILLFAY